ncbi:50S ribosomal protein L22 [Candidatus Woesearchaeota archaeon]|nr:50S ribosomal protein L22 [Candidatus Woesearchaeota archaeon]
MAHHLPTTETQAKAFGRELPLSSKQGIEICNRLRGRSVQQAKKILDDAITFKRAIPFKRFTNALGHKPGKMASGRYHPKACTLIKMVLASAEANALNKGLGTQHLMIKHLSAQKAGNQNHMGSRRGIRMRRTHIEVILESAPIEQKEKKTQTKKETTPKAETP